jgi:hypothetical protein
MSQIRRSSRRGVSAIEFALWLPVLLLFVSAVVDWGHYMTTRAVVARGVMEGCRTGATIFEPPSVVPNGSMIEPRAQARTALVLGDLGITCPAANCVLQVDYCDDGDSVCSGPPFDALQVRVEYQFVPFFGLIPTPPEIREQFIMATEHQR